MISTAIRVARVGSAAELAAAVLMMLGFPCLMLAALVPSVPAFAAAAAVTYLADHYLHRKGSYLINRLSKVRAGLSIRFLIRQLLLVLLLARLSLADNLIYYGAIACFIAFYGLQAPHGALVQLIRNRRRMPVATRNIDLKSRIRIPDAPPRRLLHRSAEKMLHLDLFAVAGILLAAQVKSALVGFVGIGITVAVASLYVLALMPYVRGRKIPPNAEKVLAAVDNWLGEYKPETVLYFSGSKDSAYQVNMWLDTMENLDSKPLIILRERAILNNLAPTTVPVICVPGGVHLMNMDLSTVRVALYAANVGKNIHMLRVPTMKHVFIGHGDSDKLASVNPFSKVYDEVWTAGRAGRDRYAIADVGVRDDDIVEVGRPQLAPIQTWQGVPEGRIPTVLYAPTWEGWDDNPGNTSILLAGENIVKKLVAADPPVRVLYKPHPFTGTRSKEAKAAHERITALVRKAAAERATDSRFVTDSAAQAQARTELARIEARIAQLAGTGGDKGRDEAEATRDGQVDVARHEEVARLRAEWNAAYWRSFPTWEHRVITGAEPRLYDCFNVSDAMVSDISSVVSDFIASGKPYAVTDSAEVGVEEFKRNNTAVRAAVILSNSADELGELLSAVRDPAADPLAEDRKELKQYLLGPDEPASIDQFNTAVANLALKAETRNVGQESRIAAATAEGELANAVPGQRVSSAGDTDGVGTG
ncbi:MULTISPECIES: CDP-glycerol glycerophosphotransferase family protein [Streptomyces]|uniref:CDP-Glycerol:Poly(Glycerophosphate)glycerophosphotransferase n=1 Tax=Streptomyces chartreusis NRRL 3882 TaxID=1079985 RepID=A0A2N9BES7_STRCX|nr:CDP-glycerol glycerophosphotransferase family protein [Streptomyces chartreusis]SOR81888.1 CDP-Glycerol:Poly(glycerophosphate)glycerophosphotransferase [Streptomyces chartreusis NRRL 3882]